MTRSRPPGVLLTLYGEFSPGIRRDSFNEAGRKQRIAGEAPRTRRTGLVVFSKEIYRAR